MNAQGLKPTEQRILDQLRGGAKTQTDLAAVLQMTESYLGRLLAGLMEANEVELAGFGKRMGARGTQPVLYRIKDKEPAA